VQIRPVIRVVSALSSSRSSASLVFGDLAGERNGPSLGSSPLSGISSGFGGSGLPRFLLFRLGGGTGVMLFILVPVTHAWLGLAGEQTRAITSDFNNVRRDRH